MLIWRRNMLSKVMKLLLWHLMLNIHVVISIKRGICVLYA